MNEDTSHLIAQCRDAFAKEIEKIYGNREEIISKDSLLRTLETRINQKLESLIQDKVEGTEIEEYDSALCITAKELREMGIEIPDHVPDCAWTEHWSIEWDVKVLNEPDGVIGVTAKITRPLRWVHVTVTRQYLS